VVSAVAVFQHPAATITTTFAGGNAFNGNMFDVEVFSQPITVTGLTIHKMDTANATLEVYTKPGTYVGSESNSVPWQLGSSSSVTGAAGSDGSSTHGFGTFVDITDFSLAASSTTELYITFTGAGGGPEDDENIMNYTNGMNTFTNADLELSLGVGKGNGGFSGRTVGSRTWNGTIHYSQVPEPSVLAGLFSLLGMSLFATRWRNRHNK
jgi:hypothetical protein